MDLGEKVRHLRAVEGIARGLERPLTKAELVRAMRAELGQSVSQAYLSQIEGGVRVHLTEATRDLLARFFKVHPGYLVSDPPDWDGAVLPFTASGDDRLKAWLLAQAELVGHEPALAHLLLRLSRQPDPRRYLWLFDHLLDLPIEEAERRAGMLRAAVNGADGETGDGSGRLGVYAVTPAAAPKAGE